jgi:hypothetical protein
MKAGFVENLVGIDVADTREHPLVEEKAFEPAATAPESLEERRPVHLQRLRTKKTELSRALSVGCRHDPDEPELPDIPKTEFPRRPSEAHKEMRVLIGGSVSDTEDELAGHLEMDNQGQSAGEIQQDHLAAPAQAADPATDQRLERKKNGSSDDRRKQQADRADLESAEMWTEAADDRFDFRELGHWLIILDLPPRFLYDA